MTQTYLFASKCFSYLSWNWVWENKAISERQGRQYYLNIRGIDQQLPRGNLFTLWTRKICWIRDFPVGLVSKTPCFHYRGHGFNPQWRKFLMQCGGAKKKKGKVGWVHVQTTQACWLFALKDLFLEVFLDSMPYMNFLNCQGRSR